MYGIFRLFFIRVYNLVDFYGKLVGTYKSSMDPSWDIHGYSNVSKFMAGQPTPPPPNVPPGEIRVKNKAGYF